MVTAVNALIAAPSAVSPIIPGTPVSTGGTASVSANGEVTFSGATSDLLVPGVFASTYITEIELEAFTSSTSLNCTWGLVTAGGTRLTTGYTGPLAQYTTSAATVSTVAGITTAWQNLRLQSTTGGHALFRVARAADTKRKSMHGGNIDASIFDQGGGWNSSTTAHTGVWFTFGGGTATGVVRFRAISNQT